MTAETCPLAALAHRTTGLPDTLCHQASDIASANYVTPGSHGDQKCRFQRRGQHFLMFYYCEQCAAKQSDLAVEKFFSIVIHEIPKNTISQELLIFKTWCTEQKIIVFDHSIGIRDEMVQSCDDPL